MSSNYQGDGRQGPRRPQRSAYGRATRPSSAAVIHPANGRHCRYQSETFGVFFDRQVRTWGKVVRDDGIKSD